MRQKPRALWAFLLTTSVIFTVWATSSSACTGIVLKGEDGTTVYGRTQEWSGFDFKTQAAVYPRNMSFQAVTPEGENGMSWKGKYGFLGFLLLDRVIGDGIRNGDRRKMLTSQSRPCSLIFILSNSTNLGG